MSESTNPSEKERIKALFLEAAQRDAEAIAELLADSPTEELLGKTEFALRDAVPKLGAKTLEGAANERAKKRGAKAAAPHAVAAPPPALRTGAPSGWSVTLDSNSAEFEPATRWGS